MPPSARTISPTHPQGPDDDLVAVELRDYFRNVTDRRQVLAPVAFHFRGRITPQKH